MYYFELHCATIYYFVQLCDTLNYFLQTCATAHCCVALCKYSAVVWTVLFHCVQLPTTW